MDRRLRELMAAPQISESRSRRWALIVAVPAALVFVFWLLARSLLTPSHHESTLVPVHVDATHFDEYSAELRTQRIELESKGQRICVSERLSPEAKGIIRGRLEEEMAGVLHVVDKLAQDPLRDEYQYLWHRQMLMVLDIEIQCLDMDTYLLMPDGPEAKGVIESLWRSSKRYRAYAMSPVMSSGHGYVTVFMVDFGHKEIAALSSKMQEIANPKNK